MKKIDKEHLHMEMTVGEVAARSGVAVSAIHFYEAKGLICLLYTSPSPRDRQKSRMPSSA